MPKHKCHGLGVSKSDTFPKGTEDIYYYNNGFGDFGGMMMLGPFFKPFAFPCSWDWDTPKPWTLQDFWSLAYTLKQVTLQKNTIPSSDGSWFCWARFGAWCKNWRGWNPKPPHPPPRVNPKASDATAPALTRPRPCERKHPWPALHKDDGRGGCYL